MREDLDLDLGGCALLPLTAIQRLLGHRLGGWLWVWVIGAVLKTVVSHVVIPHTLWGVDVPMTYDQA